jgi:MoaA/NifB/PqqE/SkfB family radical SAM enzyme
MTTTLLREPLTVLHRGREVVMPRHVQIETVGGRGMCTARCTMCTIEDWRKAPRIMKNSELFAFAADLAPFKEHIDYVTLHCNGEPLMDKRLHEKVARLKELGFRGTGFASNCTLLSQVRAEQLLDAGLDTIICSIDGATKAVHEAIRTRTDFDEVVANVERFLALRDARAAAGRKATRVIVRFILQDRNRDEYPAYKEYWNRRIDPSLGDQVVHFPIHNWGGQTENWQQNLARYGSGEVFQCEDLYERLIVFSDGEVAHCDADYNGFFPHGNVFKEHFLDVYNGPMFARYREAMESGRLCELDHCKSCSIPLARAKKGS